MAFVTGPALPATRASRTASVCNVRMSSDSPVSRRALLAGAVAAAAAAVLPKDALAEREYPNIGFLGGGEQIDINNANVRTYAKFQGFYPGLATLIVSNGPYRSVEELYDLPGITSTQKKTLDKYKMNLVALQPAAEYVIDKINNGMYK